MFTFEDLTRIDSQGIQILLRNIDKDKLAIALKGASDTLKELFFNNMSTRAGKIVKEDMDAMGPVRMREVEEAQLPCPFLGDIPDSGIEPRSPALQADSLSPYLKHGQNTYI